MPEEQPESIIKRLDARQERAGNFLDDLDYSTIQTYVHEVEGSDKKRTPKDLNKKAKEDVADKIYDAQVDSYINKFLGLSATTEEGKRRALRAYAEDTGFMRGQFIANLSKTDMTPGSLAAITEKEFKKLGENITKDTFIDLTPTEIKQLNKELVKKAEAYGLDLKEESITTREKTIAIYGLLKGADSNKDQLKSILEQYTAQE